MRDLSRPLVVAEAKRISYALFAAEALGDYFTTASIVPSSRHLARAMLEPLPLGSARVVVELGPGTGAITRALLEFLPRRARLLALELNPRFCRYLERRLADPRLLVINASAEKVGGYLNQLGCQRVDAVVSSLGLSIMSDQQRKTILRELLPYFDEKSIFTQYHYLHGCAAHVINKVMRGARLGNVFSRGWEPGRSSVAGLLRQHFRSIHTRTVWRNFPPAVVFACKK
jgi:phosphatidylethanolamine/phosphatidyl-N-methylethanolamine N-methyltransferase